MGDERTWTLIQCVECGAVAESSGESWEGWCSDGGMHGDTRKVAVVEASVLEERDRELEAERLRAKAFAGGAVAAQEQREWWEAEAESLRSQLTEARAALQELVTLKDGPRDAQYELRKPRAWEAAREFLHRSGSAPSLEKR